VYLAWKISKRLGVGAEWAIGRSEQCGNGTFSVWRLVCLICRDGASLYSIGQATQRKKCIDRFTDGKGLSEEADRLA
jgi:hypothetical protein